MAESNSYGWTSPDPFVHPAPAVHKEITIGEIQYYYKNFLRNSWVPTGVTSSFLSGNDPEWDSKVLKEQAPGFDIVIPLSDGSHLRGYDCSTNLLNKYCINLKSQRSWIEKFMGQKWSWINSSSNEDNYDLSTNLDFESNYYIVPPSVNYIQFLREVPDNRQDFIGSADFSGLLNSTSWLPTSPATAPHYAREVLGRDFGHENTFGSHLAQQRNHGVGKLEADSYSLSLLRGERVVIHWEGNMTLPLYSVVTSSIPLSQGLPLYVDSYPISGMGAFQSAIPNGLYLTDKVGIRFSTFSGGVPTYSAPAILIHENQWTMTIAVVEDNSNNGNSSFPIIYRFNMSTFEEGSVPVGKFSEFSQSNIIVKPVEDYPSLNGKWLKWVELRCTRRVDVTDDNFGAPGILNIPVMRIEGLDVLIE